MEDRSSDRRGWRLPESLRRLLAAFLLPLLLCGGIPLQGQSAQPVNGKTIESIEFKGLKTLSEDTLVYYLGLAVGEPLNLDALNKSIKQEHTKRSDIHTVFACMFICYKPLLQPLLSYFHGRCHRHIVDFF